MAVAAQDVRHDFLINLRGNPIAARNFAIEEGLLVDVTTAQPLPGYCLMGTHNCGGAPGYRGTSTFVRCGGCYTQRNIKYPVLNGVLTCKGIVQGTNLSILGRFEGPTNQALEIIYHWAHMIPVNAVVRVAATQQHQLTERTVQRLYHHLNILALIHLHRAELMGALHDNNIQIDEALFKGKRKYDRGRLLMRDLVVDGQGQNYGQAVNGPWVFGIVCRDEHENLDQRMFVVQRRDEATLRAVFTLHVEAGADVGSDMWAAYNNLALWGWPNYRHRTVNHSENFVNPITGALTQRVEACWGHAKTVIMRLEHGSQSHLQHHLAHYWFSKKFKGDVVRAALQMIRGYRPMVM